jgi:hypothetical protein
VSASRVWTAGVLAAWCLLAIGDSVNAGYFSMAGLGCILAGFVIVVVVVAVRAPLVVPDRAVLAVPALTCLAAAAINPTRRYLHIGGRDLHAVEALAIATAAVAALSLLVDRRRQRVAWVATLVLAAATGVTTIVLIGNPGIDVWAILQQSGTGLLHGDDMYRQHWVHSTGLQAVYPYLPGSTLLLAPFRWLVGDVRYGLLTASLVGAWLVRRYGADSAPPMLAALLVVVPGWVLLINRAWTEPLLITALAVAILAVRSGRVALTVVALAVALACKQHVVLLVPLFAIWPSFGLRRTAVAVGLAVLAVLPWFVAGPRDMWHDAVHANLALGAQTHALNLPALLLRHGHHVGFWLLALMLVAAYALVVWRLPRTPSGLALGAAVVMWTFDLGNTQTFFNHYMLPLGLLVIALAVADAPAVARSSPGSGASRASGRSRQSTAEAPPERSGP